MYDAVEHIGLNTYYRHCHTHVPDYFDTSVVSNMLLYGVHSHSMAVYLALIYRFHLPHTDEMHMDL